MAAAWKEKLVVIMGSTGTGKSRLSVDIATKFPSEIINSDKMQVYRGLDIATNKIPGHERAGVPHHLMDFVEPSGDLGAGEYTELAAQAISEIAARGRVPILVGGSNSYIQALVSPDLGPEFRYDCCFIWLDVDFEVLAPYLSRRVDEMMDAGLLTEMAEFYDPNESVQRGVRLSIGVPEFNRYFLRYPPDSSSESSSCSSSEEDWDPEEERRKQMLGEVVDEMKLNTVKLAVKQKSRIENFRSCGWDIHRIDATSVFEAAPSQFGHVWENTVLSPALEIVKKFLSPEPAGVKDLEPSPEADKVRPAGLISPVA
ncbi:Adenylate isopentenyltransferase 1 [Nymphaea thermarum]|nr:Adenylate isopentenyltransferase 1 [Nymphaea thermarum]